MIENGRGRPTRRHILALFGMTAGVVAASASPPARSRFIINTAIDSLYRALGPRVPLRVAATHPMQYLLSLPQRCGAAVSATTVQPRALVITIDGADHDFRGYHMAFVRARRDL